MTMGLQVGGPYDLITEFHNKHFRFEMKRIGPLGTIGGPSNGTLLILTSGNTDKWSDPIENDSYAGFGFKFVASESG